jgi:hypothetical protein
VMQDNASWDEIVASDWLANMCLGSVLDCGCDDCVNPLG